MTSVIIKNVLVAGGIFFLASCVNGLGDGSPWPPTREGSPGYQLLPVPTGQLILGARVDPESFAILGTGCISGLEIGPVGGGTISYNLTSAKGVNVNLTIKRLFSAQFSQDLIKHVNLIAVNTSIISLGNLIGDRNRSGCELTSKEVETARYVTSARSAETLSYQFIGLDGKRFDFGNKEILNKVFPVGARFRGNVNQFGNLSLGGKNLFYEVRLSKFPARKEVVVCLPDGYCSTGLLRNYQFRVSFEKFDEKKITLICYDIKSGEEILRFDLIKKQIGYFLLPDKSQVFFTLTFDTSKVGAVEIEFELVV